MNPEQLTTLWLGSFRYHLGRQSYAVSDFAELLMQEWQSLPLKCQKLIERDLREAIKRDVVQRELGRSEHLPLGMDCDRLQWVKVFNHIREYNASLYQRFDQKISDGREGWIDVNHH